jgi:hypothetical protein
MKRVLLFSIVALVLAACGGAETPEARQKKIDDLNRKIRQLETKRHDLLTAADTIQTERIYPVKVQTLTAEAVVRKATFTANLIPWEEVYMAKIDSFNFGFIVLLLRREGSKRFS